MSFLKYEQDEKITKDQGRGPISFGRAKMDGMPWRGDTPLMKSEEFQDLAQVVKDARVGLFDIRDEKQRAELQDIMDKAANDWYLIHDYDKKWGVDTDGQVTLSVFVLYSIPHRELPKGAAPGQM